jgi:hypothetical protein
MYIDCIDMTDSNLGNNRIQGLNAAKVDSTQLQFYGMSNGVAQMVTSVQNALSGGKIDVLRIWGHGGPGIQNVSGGTSGDAAANDFAGVTVDNLNQSGLDQLASLFASGGWMELRGCSVGADDAGQALLLGIANLVGVPVYGGEVTQWTVDWSPPVTCATPPGGFSTTDGPKLNGAQS